MYSVDGNAESRSDRSQRFTACALSPGFGNRRIRKLGACVPLSAPEQLWVSPGATGVSSGESPLSFGVQGVVVRRAYEDVRRVDALSPVASVARHEALEDAHAVVSLERDSVCVGVSPTTTHGDSIPMPIEWSRPVDAAVRLRHKAPPGATPFVAAFSGAETPLAPGQLGMMCLELAAASLAAYGGRLLAHLEPRISWCRALGRSSRCRGVFASVARVVFRKGHDQARRSACRRPTIMHDKTQALSC